MNNDTVDVCILGAGLAGLSLADALRERGISCCVVEKNELASGASGTPLGLVNPATGRRATKTWRAEECLETAREILHRVEPYADGRFYSQNGVLRPSLTSKIAGKMREQFDKSTWPEGWIQWKTAGEIKEIHPGIECVEGGIWIPVGMTVDVKKFLKALAVYLRKQDVAIYTQAENSAELSGGTWQIHLPGRTVSAEKLVHATGYGTVEDPLWKKHLNLHPIKGQIAVFEPEEPLTFEHSISSLGYIARLSDKRFVQGSTYEHDFDSLEPDSFGEEYLRNRLKRTLPALERQSRLAGQWAGVRISTPNKKPVLGKHPEIENLFVYTALGSKGLMYGRLMAGWLAGHIAEGDSLPPRVSVERFSD